MLQIRLRLIRDHEIAQFLNRIQSQSERALNIYKNEKDARTQEIQSIGTGDTFADFYSHLDHFKQYHKRYPNGPVESLERAYQRTEDRRSGLAEDVDGMFTGEEAFGRFFDLTTLHEEYLNLPGVKGLKKLTYLQYLDIFDGFAPPQCSIRKEDKTTDQYFSYVGSLAQYLEGFLRRTRPLEDLEKLFASFDTEFERSWNEGTAPGWGPDAAQPNGAATSGPVTEGTGEGIWCADCEKEFKNDNVYKAHLTGKKHIKNAEARKQRDSDSDVATTRPTGTAVSAERLREKAVAERENRVRKSTSVMSTVREDTRVNVERKAGMTDRERQQELAELYAEEPVAKKQSTNEDGEDEEDEAKIENPLQLPLSWDGKPIPYWLYRLHGLGVEFPCEICGNYVYRGRRAFEKHFGEARHIYGLKCLGITQTGLFREITKIDEASRLWDKIQRDRNKVTEKGQEVVEMEDTEGNVMPEKVYEDLLKQGLL